MEKRGTSPESPLSKNSNKEQERFLPIANVGRIMKKVIPGNGKISKEAKETVQECVSEFISFVTGEASDKCQREKRKTINGDDIIWAITTLGFEEYVGPLKFYLSKHRELEGDKLTNTNNIPKPTKEPLPNSLYSSTSAPPSSFATSDQSFSLTFSPTKQEPIDSVAHW